MNLVVQHNAKALLKNYLLNFFKQNLKSDSSTKDRIEYVVTAMSSVITLFKLFDNEHTRHNIEKEKRTNYSLISFCSKSKFSYNSIICILEDGYPIDVVFDLVFSPEQLVHIESLIPQTLLPEQLKKGN